MGHSNLCGLLKLVRKDTVCRAVSATIPRALQPQTQVEPRTTLGGPVCGGEVPRKMWRPRRMSRSGGRCCRRTCNATCPVPARAPADTARVRHRAHTRVVDGALSREHGVNTYKRLCGRNRFLFEPSGRPGASRAPALVPNLGRTCVTNVTPSSPPAPVASSE